MSNNNTDKSELLDSEENVPYTVGLAYNKTLGLYSVQLTIQNENGSMQVVNMSDFLAGWLSDSLRVTANHAKERNDVIIAQLEAELEEISTKNKENSAESMFEDLE